MTGSDFTASRKNGRPRGYAAWRPQAKTRVILDQVNDILDEYADHLPLTLRQIFYRLVGANGYAKTEQAYGRLGETLVRARRARMIAFESIRDDAVVVYSHDAYTDVDAFWDDVRRRARAYRRERQEGQPYRLELWCEAAGMAPQLATICSDYGVDVHTRGGFNSLPAVRSIVDRATERDTGTVLLHVGDFDPSGESIFDAIAADAAAFLDEDRRLANQTIHAVRVALTGEQVETFGLPTAPAKTTDSRTKNWSGETCQLEALAPDQLADLVRAELDKWFDPHRLAATLRQEADDRHQLLRALPPGTAE